MARQGFGVQVEGLRELRRDLKAIDRKLPRDLNRGLKKAMGPVRAEAAALAPNRTGALARSLKVGTRGSAVLIRSRLPYARVAHWGGRHPLFGDRERWYPQYPKGTRPSRFVVRAAARNRDETERQLFATIERLMRDAGFRSK